MMVRTRPGLVLEQPDRQDPVGLPPFGSVSKAGRGKKEYEPAAAAGRGRREQAPGQERGERPQGSPGVSTKARRNRARLPSAPARSATERASAAPTQGRAGDEARHGRGCARGLPAPPLPGAPPARSSAGPSATARTASAGSPARRAQAEDVARSPCPRPARAPSPTHSALAAGLATTSSTVRSRPTR